MRNGSFDAIVIGAGVMGLSLAIELRKQLARVLVLERSQVGREASYAAAGMLNVEPNASPDFLSFARHSQTIYPRYVEAIRGKSRSGIEFHRTGAIVLSNQRSGERLDAKQLQELEPELVLRDMQAWFVQEDFVGPRSLMKALEEHSTSVGINLETDRAVSELMAAGSCCIGVRCSDQREFSAPVVVNCAGAWANAITNAPQIPTRPVKGQMLSVEPRRPVLRHVVRCAEPEVYMLPRASGTVAIGATVEEVGYNVSTTESAIHELRSAAEKVIPALNGGAIHESWAGLRPGSPDGLPIIGETALPGYFAATGHFRHGILLAPATAEGMADLIINRRSNIDLTAFSPQRFAA